MTVRVQRMALGLTGRDDVGKSVVQYVLRRGLRAIDSWLDDGEPERWCQHHTVLIARRAAKHPPDVSHDTLIRHAQTENAYYAAFIRALRTLPGQQREAFILTHGEQMDLRNLAVSMDCSTEAASNHLKQASGTLSKLAGTYFPTFTAQLTQTYRSLTPSDDLILTDVRWNARRHVWPRRIYRWLKILGIAVALALLGVVCWMFPKLVI